MVTFEWELDCTTEVLELLVDVWLFTLTWEDDPSPLFSIFTEVEA